MSRCASSSGSTHSDINVLTVGDDGTLVNEHDEAGSGQEELYFVIDGTATFEVDGETIDAPQGTFLYVGRGSAAEGDRERNHPRDGRDARRGVSGGRLG